MKISWESLIVHSLKELWYQIHLSTLVSCKKYHLKEKYTYSTQLLFLPSNKYLLHRHACQSTHHPCRLIFAIVKLLLTHKSNRRLNLDRKHPPFIQGPRPKDGSDMGLKMRTKFGPSHILKWPLLFPPYPFLASYLFCKNVYEVSDYIWAAIRTLSFQ